MNPFKTHISITRRIAQFTLSALLLFNGGASTFGATCITCSGEGGSSGSSTPSSSPSPHVALQIAPCPSASLQTLLQSQVNTVVTSAVQNLLEEGDSPPIPDTRSTCTNGKLTIAVWFYPTGTYGSGDTAASRTMRMNTLNLLGTGETFGMRFGANALSELVNIAFERAKDLVAGTAARVTDYAIHYNTSAKTVTTAINGYIDGVFNDTDFTVGIADTLSISPLGGISCYTKTWFEHETTLDTVLVDILALDVPSFDPSSQISRGPACAIAGIFPTKQLLPGSISLFGGSKIAFKETFTYTRLQVDYTGITASGTHATEVRDPWVSIKGPNPVWVEPQSLATGIYRIMPSDMRTPIQVTWSAPGATISQPYSGWTSMTWNLGNVGVDDVFHRTISVTAKDADGLTASRSLTISFKSSLAQPDPLDPKPCFHNPDLCDPLN